MSVIPRVVVFRRSALIPLCALALFGGCLRSTDAEPSELRLAGEWAYTGVQSGPVRENLAGQLRIIDASRTSFHGQLHVVAENDATGETRIVDGSVSGTSDGAIVDFDANVETGTRRHVGQIVADTITGTWVASSSGGVTSSGTFRANRETQ